MSGKHVCLSQYLRLTIKEYFVLCWGLITRQPLWVILCHLQEKGRQDDDDDEFRFNDASTHEGHLRQNGELTWFCNETIIISHRETRDRRNSRGD